MNERSARLRLLILGKSGQLAQALVRQGEEAAANGHSFSFEPLAFGRPDWDLHRPETLETLIEKHSPALILNASAMTQVDLAETRTEEARQLNHLGVQAMGKIAARHKMPLIHISTDYVFDGKSPYPYRETDPANPLSVYGRTKRDGEKALLAAHNQALVFRTSWLYSPTGRNFARTMLKLAQKRPELAIVSDQRGSPTSADDLARVLLRISEKLVTQDFNPRWAGIYHASGGGETDWASFAARIFALKAAREPAFQPPNVRKITAKDYPTPAQRPQKAVLDNRKLLETFGEKLKPWEEALAAVIPKIQPESETA